MISWLGSGYERTAAAALGGLSAADNRAVRAGFRLADVASAGHVRLRVWDGRETEIQNVTCETSPCAVTIDAGEL